MKITREAILEKTHYGLKIYCYVLQQYYPKDIMKLSGRDCGLCRNPFSDGLLTLHIWIEKSDPSFALSNEVARHEDVQDGIAAGDALDFASLYFKLSGDALLEAINECLHLHVGEHWSFNRYVPDFDFCCPSNTQILQTCDSIVGAEEESSFIEDRNELPRFSLFHSPISNCLPEKTVTLPDVYCLIVSNVYAERTDQLHKIEDEKAASRFKREKFDYVTFSGIFSRRNAKSLIRHSGYLCLDFDDLDNVEGVREMLLHDDYFDTMLLFRSPSGNGLKWIVEIDVIKYNHDDYFCGIANYISKQYGIEVDMSGKDVCRACFLPFDPNAYINPSIIQ